MSVKLYGTIGAAGSYSKDTSDERYVFYPEPKIDWDYKKVLDIMTLPMEMHPWVMDGYSQERKIVLNGVLKQTTASDPTGEKTLAERQNEMDAIFSFNSTWSAQPTIETSKGKILCLEVTIPNSGGYVKQAFVVPESLHFGFNNHTMTFSATFVEGSELLFL